MLERGAHLRENRRIGVGQGVELVFQLVDVCEIACAGLVVALVPSRFDLAPKPPRELEDPFQV
jgi:hypothetical protein